MAHHEERKSSQILYNFHQRSQNVLNEGVFV